MSRDLFTKLLVIISFSFSSLGFAEEVKPAESSSSILEQSLDPEAIAKEYYLKGNDAYRQNNLSEAIIYFEKALRSNPQDLQPLYWMNQACGGLALTNAIQSINCYEKEVELDPKNAFDYYKQIAFEYSYYLRRQDRAIEFYKKSIELYPPGKGAKGLADIYIAMGSYEKAKDICEKAGFTECVKEADMHIRDAHLNQELNNDIKKFGQDSNNNAIFAGLIIFITIGLLIFIGWTRRLAYQAIIKNESPAVPRGVYYISRGILFA